jgi:spore coat protein U-like protein
MHKFIKSAFVAGALVATASANAATVGTSFQVTASVLARCTASATALAFGTYNPGVAAVDQSTDISVRCTRGTTFTVGLNEGLTTGASVTTRRMRSTAAPAEELAYSLYTTAARTTNWGFATAAEMRAGTGTGYGNTLIYTVYGRIPDTAANQNALVAADYTDTINVTVTY